MDEPPRNEEASDYSDGDDPVVPPLHTHSTDHPEQPVSTQSNHQVSHQKGWYVPKRHRRKAKAYWRQFRRAGADRHIELLIAAAVLFFVVLQYWNIKINNKSTSDQVDKIIAAAAGIQDAATQMKNAAWDFKGSAQGIDGNLGDAVAKLQDQADKMESARKTSETQSKKALDAAIANFQQQQRAWIAIAAAAPGNFTKETGYPVTITFADSGNTPATNIKFGQRFMMKYAPVDGPGLDEIAQIVIDEHQHDVPPRGELIITVNDAERPTRSFSQLQIAGDKSIQDHFDDIRNDRVILYYFGTIEYNDGFSPTPRHSNFCLFIADPIQKTIGSCKTFNDIH